MLKGRKIPVWTFILVGINILVYLITECIGSSYDTDFMLKMGASYEPLILEQHQYYRLVTHFFLHFGFEHLANNMFSLLVMGYTLEQVMGPLRYMMLYFLSGILAGLTSIVYNVYISGEYAVSCGASGAVYGLLGALLVLLFFGSRTRRTSEIPRYLLYIGLSIYSGMQDPSIDNAAHVGGFVAGALICLLMARRKQMEVTYES